MSGERVIEFGRVCGNWSDDVVYVIGGGPSLKDFDFTNLSGYKIGANKSAIVANCDTLFTLDKHYANQAREDIKNFPGDKIVALRNYKEHDPIEGAIYVKCLHTGLSTDVTSVCGLNSGYGAINVAFLKGAKEIRLLGFDMKMQGDKHFHGGYSWDNTKGNYKSWAVRFNDMLPTLKEFNVNVINYVGPSGSNVQCFPTRPLEELQ